MDGKGKAKPEICAGSSRDELRPPAEWNGFREFNLSPSSWFLSLRIMLLDLALVSVAEKWDIWQWQKLD